MTATINGHRLTVGDGVHGCVRAPENPSEAAVDPDSGSESAFTPVHARVIPDPGNVDKGRAGSPVRNFASQHGREALTALNQSWLLTEVPMTAGEAWRDVFPQSGTAPSKGAWTAMATAGLFRALAVSLLHLILLAVETRLRAGVALIVCVLAVTGSYAAHNL